MSNTKWGHEESKGHGQLIEINSKGLLPTDADRYAGIYQRIGGLHPGATYVLTLRGLLRGEGNEDDPYRFEAQWGYSDGSPDWRGKENLATSFERSVSSQITRSLP